MMEAVPQDFALGELRDRPPIAGKDVNGVVSSEAFEDDNSVGPKNVSHIIVESTFSDPALIRPKVFKCLLSVEDNFSRLGVHARSGFDDMLLDLFPRINVGSRMRVTRLDLDGTGSPLGLAGKILEAEPNLVIPVPIEELASRLDIQEIAELTTAGFEGGLRRRRLRS
ncbi:hypothetical protein [Sphingopyxis sp. KK2]|uniref:hypothetical protein n=1 Tax=Sphingopyxis sp. KK2 TaxID=1855727 RepID=UPI001C4E2964|nr:hypothetical protein [Sphingopyxis sp. KK2]